MAVKGQKSKKTEASAAEAVITTVKALKTTDVMAEIAQAQVEVQKTFAGISAQVTQRMSILDTINQAIALGESRLKEIHGIDAAATSIDDLEAEIAERREEWDREQQQHLQAIAERDAELQKTRQREQADYAYKINAERQKITDDFQTQVIKQKRDEQMRQETMAAGWAAREAAISAAEKELADLRAQVAALPDVIKKAVDREVAIVGNAMKRDHQQALEIVRLNAENEQKIAQSTIANLTKQYEQQGVTIASLQKELHDANARTEAIAAKAVEASSGREVSAALMRAAESQNGPVSGKGGRS